MPSNSKWLIPTILRKEQARKAATCFRLRLVNQLYQRSCYAVTVNIFNSTICHWTIKMEFHTYARTAGTALQTHYLCTALKYWSFPPSQSHMQIAEPYPALVSQTYSWGLIHAKKAQTWTDAPSSVKSNPIHLQVPFPQERWRKIKTFPKETWIKVCPVIDSHPARQGEHSPSTASPQPKSL